MEVPVRLTIVVVSLEVAFAVALMTDTGPQSVVDRQVLDLVLDEPAVAVAADGAADDVGWVAARPGPNDRPGGLLRDRKCHAQRTALRAVEGMLERIPAGVDDLDRLVAGIGRISPAAVAIVASRDHEAQRVGPCIEDEVASEVAAGVVDRRRPVESPIEMALRPGDIQIDVEVRPVAAGRQCRAVAAPVGEGPAIDWMGAAARLAYDRGRSQAETGMVIPGGRGDAICVAAPVRVTGRLACDGAAVVAEPAIGVLFEPIEVRTRRC